MESAVSFAPLRPADFVNFAGRGGARPAFRGAGRGSLFFRGAGRGGAYIPGSYKYWRPGIQSNALDMYNAKLKYVHKNLTK